MKRFNIRVYGILINEENQVLVSDESRFGIEFTKFPGGGLEFGEGISDCLKREFLEELKLEIKVEELVYLTDYFQVSAFNPDDQVISIYYKVSYNNPSFIKTNQMKRFTPEQENHRWININKLSKLDFTFPIDQLVAEILNKQS